jgi:hypothetical protein
MKIFLVPLIHEYNLILPQWQNTSAPKFTSGGRQNIEGIVGNLSLKRIPDSEIIKEVYKQTSHKISRQTLYNVG